MSLAALSTPFEFRGSLKEIRFPHFSSSFRDMVIRKKSDRRRRNTIRVKSFKELKCSHAISRFPDDFSPCLLSVLRTRT